MVTKKLILKKQAEHAVIAPPDEQEKRFMEWLTDNIAACQRTIDKFADDVKEHPQYALEWSSKVFETAAMHKAYHCLKSTVEQLGIADGIIAFREDMQKQAMDRAMYPESSCSVPSNFASRCLTSALLRVCRDLQLRWREIGGGRPTE